jgi:hypothetical protein
MGQITLVLTDNAEKILRTKNSRKGDMGKYVSKLIDKAEMDKKIDNAFALAKWVLNRFGAKGPQSENDWKEYEAMGGIRPSNTSCAQTGESCKEK